MCLCRAGKETNLSINFDQINTKHEKYLLLKKKGMRNIFVFFLTNPF